MKVNTDLIYLGRSVIESHDENGNAITWQDGSSIHMVSVLDPDTEDLLSLAVDPSCTGELPATAGSPFAASLRVRKDRLSGRAKYRLLAVSA